MKGTHPESARNVVFDEITMDLGRLAQGGLPGGDGHPDFPPA